MDRERGVRRRRQPYLGDTLSISLRIRRAHVERLRKVAARDGVTVARLVAAIIAAWVDRGERAEAEA
jgi:predicted DNA-binding ribbon-helix-helix protein